MNEVFEAALAKVATLPAWDEVEVELRDLFHSTPPRSVGGEPSQHVGLQAVYEHIQGILASNLALARTEMADCGFGERP